MRTFFTVWAGQLISIIGTGLTQFGLAIWVFIETGSVTSLAAVVLAASVPAIIVGLFAGAIVDRQDRRLVMIAADTLTGVGAAVLAVLFLADSVELWHILVVAAVSSMANAFQEPGWLASVPLLVPKKQLNRANGMTQANQALGLVLTERRWSMSPTNSTPRSRAQAKSNTSATRPSTPGSAGRAISRSASSRSGRGVRRPSPASPVPPLRWSSSD